MDKHFKMQAYPSVIGSHSLQSREWANLPVSSGNAGDQSHQRRITLFSTSQGSFVQIDDINGLLQPGISVHEFCDTVVTEGPWWLEVVNPTEQDIDTLAKAFSIHPLTTEDIKTREAIEKVESFKQHYFCSIRSFYKDSDVGENNLEPANFYAIVFGRGILTFTFGQSTHAANVRQRIGKLRTGALLSGNWICYALIDDIVDSFGPFIRQIEQETATIEDSTFTVPEDDSGPLLQQIYRCRMKITVALNLLRDKNSVIKSFARLCDGQSTTAPQGEIHLYLSDVQDHVATMMSDLDHFDNMLSRCHANFLSRLSTDAIETRNRTVTALGRMAIIGGIVVALNVVCSLFGMNVPVPGRDSVGLYWFLGILSVVAIITAVGGVFLTRMIRLPKRPGHQ